MSLPERARALVDVGLVGVDVQVRAPFGAMNGWRGGSAASTGCCGAGAPMNAVSEPACGPSGIGAGGAAAAGAASSAAARRR